MKGLAAPVTSVYVTAAASRRRRPGGGLERQLDVAMRERSSDGASATLRTQRPHGRRRRAEEHTAIQRWFLTCCRRFTNQLDLRDVAMAVVRRFERHCSERPAVAELNARPRSRRWLGLDCRQEHRRALRGGSVECAARHSLRPSCTRPEADAADRRTSEGRSGPSTIRVFEAEKRVCLPIPCFVKLSAR